MFWKCFSRRLALTAALVLCLAAAPTALAAKDGGSGGGGGKPSRGGTATISLATVSSADGVPRWNDRVTFSVATTATTQPWVNLRCYQGGALVSEAYEGYFDGALGDRVFGLSSPIWTSGTADCTARVTTPQGTQLGSMSFHVEA